MLKTKAEYIWLDGHKPTQKLRSKTKVIGGSIEKVEDLPSGALMAQVQIRLRGKIVTACSNQYTWFLIQLEAIIAYW